MTRPDDCPNAAPQMATMRPRRWARMFVCLATLAACLSLTASVWAATDEFIAPSPNGAVAVSAYNTTPSCPLTVDQPSCDASAIEPPPDPNNNEAYLNSAYWPSEKRPDIKVYAINRYGYQYQNCAALLPHYCFLVDAEAVGYPVTHTPQVGDLWLAPCAAMTWEDGAGAECDGETGWYMGYVDQVLPDGSFYQSWGGSATPADTGLSSDWMSASMDPNTDFIGFFPTGSYPSDYTQITGRTVTGSGSGSRPGSGSSASHRAMTTAVLHVGTFASGNHARVTVQVRVAGKGTVSARAVDGLRRVGFHAARPKVCIRWGPNGVCREPRPDPNRVILTATLSAGHWTVTVTGHPERGYTAPSPRRVGVRVG